jgi:hypothetical protein
MRFRASRDSDSRLASPEESNDDAAYADAPVGLEEFSSEDGSLGWDADGWEHFSEAR